MRVAINETYKVYNSESSSALRRRNSLPVQHLLDQLIGFRIGNVPLFSGFMYASVGSFIARITRILDMRYARYPNMKLTAGLAVLIYANFFTHHFIPDVRIALFIFIAIAFGPTWVYYRPYRKYRRMPLLLGFCLVALFIFAAENIGTFATIWVYPNQRDGWHLVYFSKFGSWLLLMIISFILVSFAHPPRELATSSH